MKQPPTFFTFVPLVLFVLTILIVLALMWGKRHFFHQNPEVGRLDKRFRKIGLFLFLFGLFLALLIWLSAPR